MVARGIGLVYGGGNMGLMGAVAKATHDAGGAVHGVIPEAMTKIEGIGLLGETTLVKTMHERKSLMNDLSDAFIALPGGFGTFEELLEMTTWSQLSIHSKPIGVLNVAGFYDPLVALVDGAAREGFVKEGNRGLVIVRDNVDALLDALQAFRPPEGRFDIPWSAV
ncbi:hypothetical protein DFJ73DRAFT_852097 [Zopfochytrium polystomum]|nr:hypothetical protein DFJ73DRAFT_852097 [Zopfochytrium polystomum]